MRGQQLATVQSESPSPLLSRFKECGEGEGGGCHLHLPALTGFEPTVEPVLIPVWGKLLTETA